MNTALTKVEFPGQQLERIIQDVFGQSRSIEEFLFGNEENYPPYNAWIEESGDCMIEIAVSGFTKEELQVEFDGKILLVRGNKIAAEPDRRWIKRGLARRAFTRRFEVRGSCSLQSASLKNGLLTITLKDETQKVTVEIAE